MNEHKETFFIISEITLFETTYGYAQNIIHYLLRVSTRGKYFY
jgi:hypothetical protein